MAVALPFQNPFTTCILEYSLAEYITFTVTFYYTLTTEQTGLLCAISCNTSVVFT